jgi:hypothetical protein
MEITVHVLDLAGNWNQTDALWVSVSDNDPPEILLDLNWTIINGQTFIFNATTCSDNDRVENYTWTFEYEGERVDIHSATGSFEFIKPDQYQIYLNLSDPSGNQVQGEFTLEVVDTIPPVPVISGNLNARFGQPIRLNAYNSTDNGRIRGYSWNFNDRSFSDSGERSIGGPELTYIFENGGYYTIELEVMDEWRNTNSTSVIVQVDHWVQAYANAGGDRTVAVGVEITFEANADWSEIIPFLNFTWKYDHNGEEVVLYGPVQFITFENTGTYDITLEARNSEDEMARDLITITVKDTGILRGIIFVGKEDPAANALVEVIDADGNLFDTTTADNGTFELEIKQGTVTWTISKNGFESISGTAEIKAVEITDLDPDGIFLERKEEGTNWSMIVIVTILILLIILIIIATVIIRTRMISDRIEAPEEGEEIGTPESTQGKFHRVEEADLPDTDQMEGE